MKVALILEGGALRGIFTAGVIDNFIDHDIQFDYVCGVSCGACNELAYLGKTRGFLKECTLTDGIEKFYGPKQFVETRHLINLDMVFNDYARIFHFDWKTFNKNTTPWEMVCSNLVTGKADYLSSKKQKEVVKIGQASCSIPLMTDPVEINGNLYLDGGTTCSIPVRRAYELGYDKVVAVLTRKKGSYSKVSPAELRVMKQVYSEYPDFLEAARTRKQRYMDEVKFCEEKEKEGSLILIRPTFMEVNRLESDKEDLSLAYYHGYTKADQNLEQIQKWTKK